MAIDYRIYYSYTLHNIPTIVSRLGRSRSNTADLWAVQSPNVGASTNRTPTQLDISTSSEKYRTIATNTRRTTPRTITTIGITTTGTTTIEITKRRTNVTSNLRTMVTRRTIMKWEICIPQMGWWMCDNFFLNFFGLVLEWNMSLWVPLIKFWLIK